MNSFLSGFGGVSSSLASQQRLNEDIQRSMWDIYQRSQLPYEQEYLSYMRSMLPLQDEYARLALGTQQHLLPYESKARIDALQAQRDLLPYELQSQQDRLKGVSEVRGIGLQGVDVNDRINQAIGDAKISEHAQREGLQRNLQRQGVDPSSGRYADAQRQMASDAHKSQAWLMSQGRRQGEMDDWMRRYQAAQL